MYYKKNKQSLQFVMVIDHTNATLCDLVAAASFLFLGENFAV